MCAGTVSCSCSCQHECKVLGAGVVFPAYMFHLCNTNNVAQSRRLWMFLKPYQLSDFCVKTYHLTKKNKKKKTDWFLEPVSGRKFDKLRVKILTQSRQTLRVRWLWVTATIERRHPWSCVCSMGCFTADSWIWEHLSAVQQFVAVFLVSWWSRCLLLVKVWTAGGSVQHLDSSPVKPCCCDGCSRQTVCHRLAEICEAFPERDAVWTGADVTLKPPCALQHWWSLSRCGSCPQHRH